MIPPLLALCGDWPTCAHGVALYVVPCPACDEAMREAHAWCQQEIAAGRMTERLYTPREWVAKLRRDGQDGAGFKEA